MTFESLELVESELAEGNESICMAVSRLGFKSVWLDEAAKLRIGAVVQK